MRALHLCCPQGAFGTLCPMLAHRGAQKEPSFNNLKHNGMTWTIYGSASQPPSLCQCPPVPQWGVGRVGPFFCKPHACITSRALHLMHVAAGFCVTPSRDGRGVRFKGWC